MRKHYTTKRIRLQNALAAEYDSLGAVYTAPPTSFTGNGTNSGNLLYFYHPDHLGSSSLITNADGVVTQHVEYIPFGEVFIEERNKTWNTPYLFNGKERDEETGLYYYGARYYDSRTSVWLSVDPLKEIYPNASSYLFCNANPVRYIDPNGMDWYEHRNGNGKNSYIWQEGNKSSITINNQEYNNAGQYHTTTTSDGSVSVYYNQNNIVDVSYNDNKSSAFLSSQTILSAITSYAQHTQYSKTLGIWRGINGKIYEGLSGRGPNRFTGSRSLAKAKSARIGIASNILTGLGIGITELQYQYDMKQNPGPNLKKYLEMRHTRDQSFNTIGFLRIYGAATSFGYNLGYLIENVTNRNIQLNPFTNDFTPIEETLTDFDNVGIYVY